VNVISQPFTRLPAIADDPQYGAACAVHADAHIRSAMQILGDQIGAVYGQRVPLTPEQGKTVAGMRNALVALSHASNLLAPLTTEKMS
jgi:hypothetical protein